MKQRRDMPPAMGGTSLLVSFAVLLLTVLALLCLSQSRAEQNRAEASAQAVAEFYAADMEAEKILARLRSGESVPGVREEQGICFYSCPVSAVQTLYVEVEKDTWTILRWETVVHPEQPNEALPVWAGQKED